MIYIPILQLFVQCNKNIVGSSEPEK